ncbi:AMP-dependent synthetase/ligase [Rhodococcus artemisiae]|uniref:Long-chain fatty acid--CoA ligase n=1 Tax=Rhodococcus artemisiae TaxID=714159 RepID=A0ABU7L916_9NOCA|nr:long-chain fatty acid--CoA ligase [Rhodococcus artemisiae]MEE2058048.1 long-chain fatty acid--CoA ligase [Rhodococcus artemisiae]
MTTMRASEEKVDHAKIEKRAPSVARLFIDRVTATPDDEAFRYPDGKDGWTSITWEQTGEKVRLLAAGLLSLGVDLEDRVALASSTRFEWVLADLAVMCAGGATTTVYPTTNAPDVAFIVSNSGSHVVIAEDSTQVEKLTAHRGELPDVAKVVVIDGPGDGDWVIGFDDLAELGRARLAEDSNSVIDRIHSIEPAHLATVIYTSGTTGKPKGVRLPHSAWTYEAAAVDSVGLLGRDDLQYLWLPLSHVFGKVLLTLPLQIGFSTTVDGRVDKIVENLAVVRPTFMGAAPRIFEKAHARVEGMMAEEGGIKKVLFDWAMGVGTNVSKARQDGRSPGLLDSAQHKVADKLVLSTIRERFGGRLRFFISGSAALNPDVAQWFDAVGIPVLEGYGLTETSAASCVNRPQANRLGTVGWPLPGTEVKIAEDGEVLIKGPGVMTGYHDRPDATAEALEADGWFHTGDIGSLDDDGYLKITDRKKDMFKTSQGKYVAPSAIAATFKGISPYAAEIIVHGEGKPYCVALVALDAEAVTEWAAKNGLDGQSFSDITQHDKTRELISKDIDQLNLQLNRWEQVKKFTIIERELSIEEGDLTPSMKLRRKVVVDTFSDSLTRLYE